MSRDWFTGRYYEKPHQPSTLLKNKGIKRELEALVARKSKGPALEIGAVKRGVIGKIKERTYADLMLGQLKLVNPRLKGNRARATVVRLPFKDRSFGIAVANEVLTHVRPAQRVDAIREMARVADSIVVTDRYLHENRLLKDSIDEFKKWKMYDHFVKFEPLEKELKKEGFSVEVKPCGVGEHIDYFILYATREKAPEGKIRKSA
jgi:hypothetical protein